MTSFLISMKNTILQETHRKTAFSSRVINYTQKALFVSTKNVFLSEKNLILNPPM